MHSRSTSERLLSSSELRQFLGISKPTYVELLRRGIPSVRIGRGGRRTHRRFHVETVLAWLHRDAGPTATGIEGGRS